MVAALEVGVLVFGALQNDLRLYLAFRAKYQEHCCAFWLSKPERSFLIWAGRAERYGRPGGALVQSRDLRRVVRRFGDVRPRNERQPTRMSKPLHGYFPGAGDAIAARCRN